MPLSLYLDASAIVPLLIEDALRQRSLALLPGLSAGPIVSDFGLAEVASALARRVRMTELTRDEAFSAHGLLDRWSAQASIVLVRSDDIAEAGRLLRRLDLPLRTPDALHIAVARRLDVALATFDRGMAEVGRALGLDVRGA